MTRINYSSGAKWEDIVGYSRAVKIGNTIEISGCTSVDDHGNIVGENDPYTETKFILSKIENYLTDLGATLEDVVRTRMYVTDISKWEQIGRAHGDFFKAIKPATIMVEVSGLIDPRMTVEIEATAILS